MWWLSQPVGLGLFRNKLVFYQVFPTSPHGLIMLLPPSEHK